MVDNDNTFIKITNQDIYDEIMGIKSSIGAIKETTKKIENQAKITLADSKIYGTLHWNLNRRLSKIGWPAE